MTDYGMTPPTLKTTTDYGMITPISMATMDFGMMLLEKGNVKPQGVIYFRCADIALAVGELSARGVKFDDKPHLIAKMDDHDLWMTFFKDPDGHTLALMQEAPKGYSPKGS